MDGGSQSGMSSRAGSSFSSEPAVRRSSAQPLRPAAKSRVNDKSRDNHDNGNQNSNDDEEPKKNFKPVIRFLVTNIGMIVFVILYILGGAFLFQLLEQHNEIQNCQEGEGEMSNLIIAYRTQLFNYIHFNVTLDPWLPVSNTSGATAVTGLDGPDVHNPKLYGMLQNFRADILLTRSSYSYYGQDCIVNSLWNFESAILFAVTVVTTIGYGHVTPKTWEGQIVCICYATLGIPMFLMSVANVSSILGDLFRFLYSHIFCFVCNAMMKDSEEEEAAKAAKKQKPKAVNAAAVEPETDWELSADGKPKKQAAAVVVDSNESDDDDERVSVPLIVVVMIFCLYTGFGGYLFDVLEEWSMVSSCYFSFVSLSTMGFGDYVPGLSKLASGNDTGRGGRNLLIASIYIFFGMAILAMCFDLIQEGLIHKFTLIGEKTGIIKKEEEEEAEEEKVREEVFDSGETEEAALREKLKLQEQINNRTPSRVTSTMMVPDGNNRASFVMTSNEGYRTEPSAYGGFKEPSVIFIKPSTSQGSSC